jgi:hypothetical protein
MWNEIRDEIRERLPAIVDFVFFAATMTATAAVLLGLRLESIWHPDRSIGCMGPIQQRLTAIVRLPRPEGGFPTVIRDGQPGGLADTRLVSGAPGTYRRSAHQRPFHPSPSAIPLA